MTKEDKQDQPPIGEILRVPHSFVLCEEQQSSGLVNSLVQSAKTDGRKFCVLDAADPHEFERLLTSAHFDTQTQVITAIPGPLWECLEDKKGGRLIVLNPLAPTAEGLLNGVFDQIPLRDLSGQHTIKIAPQLQIIGIHTATNQFKISQLTKSWRDRFHQHLWLSDSKQLPLSCPSFFASSSEFDEKLATKVIDCQFHSSDQLRSHWFHSYPLDEKGARGLKRGALAALFTDSQLAYPQIKFENLDIDDPTVKKSLQELQHSPIQKIDDDTYDFSQCRFFFEPADLKKLQTRTAGKNLKKIDPAQLSRLKDQQRIWWLNRQNVMELHELLYSAPTGKDQYVWRTKPGFLNYFQGGGGDPVLVIYEFLSPASWHRLLQDQNIQTLYVLDGVFIPQPWTSLFTTGEIPLTESKTTTETASPVQIYLCHPAQQAALIRRLKEEKSGDSLVITTSNDHGVELLQEYDSQRHYRPGPLWQAFSESRSLIISGETLITKLPNLFSPLGVLAASNGDIKEFKSQITLVIDPLTYDKHPCLQILPKITVEKSFESESESTPAPGGYAGIKKALHDGQRIILGKGPKASGKSHSISRLVEDKIAQVFTYTLSPFTRFSDLAPVVKSWSEPNPKDEKCLRVMVFDEMNLADPQTLLWLQALITTPETIILPGNKIISLTAEHRMIGLMNKAEATAGRHVHPVIEALAYQVEFDALTDAEFKQVIARQTSILDSSEDDALLFQNLMRIRQAVSLLAPGLTLTARDFQSIIARLASCDYQPAEMKSYADIDSKSRVTAHPLLSSALQIISPQLPASKRRTFRHWLQILCDFNFEDQPSPVCAMWLNNLLKKNPQLWNNSSSRRLMSTVLGYLQTHAFYQQQKKRLMPGKFGLLLMGETNTGKTFLSDLLLKIWGYKAGENWFEWTAGAHGDLAALIAKNLMTSIQEANMISTEILEGAINAIVPSEDNAEFGLILTANSGYRYREMLSEPLLSRLHVINIDSPAPEEILSLSPLSPKDQAALLASHQQAGQLASIRGLLNAIQLRKSGLPLDTVCGMVYGLILKEIKKSLPLLAANTGNSFADFLEMIGETHLIVSETKAAEISGALNRTLGIIVIPPLPLSPTENDHQRQYDLVLLRAMEYQHGTIEKAMEVISQQYTGAHSRIMKLTTGLSPPSHPYSNKNLPPQDIFSQQHTYSGGLNITENKNNIAEFSEKKSLCVPLKCYRIDQRSGLPIFQDEQFSLTELPRHFFPEQAPDEVEETIQITLKSFKPTVENTIPLFTLPGYYPKIGDTEAKIVWRTGKFCAAFPQDKTLPVDKPLSYVIIRGPWLKSTPSAQPALAIQTYQADEKELSHRVRRCLTDLRAAKEISEQKSAFQLLCQVLKTDFMPLDSKNHHQRQALNNAYQKNDIRAVISHCLTTKKVVCLESGLILYVLSRPILAKLGIPIYLMSGNLANQGIMTGEGHTFVIVKWPGDVYPLTYDSAPYSDVPVSQDSTNSPVAETTLPFRIIPEVESSLTLPSNSLLTFYKDRIAGLMEPYLINFYKFSLKNQRPVYHPHPPGVLNPIREYFGLPAFQLSLLDQKRTPQTLIITAFPYFEISDNSDDFYTCMHFLAEILLDKNFKLMVWTINGVQPGVNADIFMDLLINRLHTPKNEDLGKFTYPFPFLMIDESHWHEVLIPFAQILSKQCQNEEVLRDHAKKIQLQGKNLRKKQEEFYHAADHQRSLDGEFYGNLSRISLMMQFHQADEKILAESKKISQELMDYEKFLTQFNGNVECTVLKNRQFSSSNSEDLTITSLSLRQADINSIIINFPAALVNKTNWRINFVKCEFSERIHFKNLPPCFVTFKVEQCRKYFPDFQSLPLRIYKIYILNSIFKDHHHEIDKLLNKTLTEFVLIIDSQLLAKCTYIKNTSPLSKLIINDSLDLKDCKQIVLEKPIKIITKNPVALTLICMLNNYYYGLYALKESNKNDLAFVFDVFFQLMERANIQKVSLILESTYDMSKETYQAGLEEFKQKYPSKTPSFPITFFSASDSIVSFTRLFEPTKK